MTESWDERLRNGLKVLFGDTNEKRLKTLEQYVKAANALEPQMQSLNDEQLKGKTALFKQQIEDALAAVEDMKLIPDDAPKMPGQFRTQKDKVLAEVLEGLLPEAFAVVREASKRVLNMRHFDTQLLGALLSILTKLPRCVPVKVKH